MTRQGPPPTVAREDLDRAYRLQLWKLGLTFLGGVVAAALTGVAPAWIPGDVRNQVYEATYEDKRRALDAQSELLKLQEEYLKKLEDARVARDRMAEVEKRLHDREDEVTRVRAQMNEAMTALRSRYRALELAERRRQSNARAAAEERARAAPYKDHVCAVDAVFTRTGNDVCHRGYRAVFAPGTVDERIVVEAEPKCGKHSYTDAAPAEKACEKYGISFLMARGFPRTARATFCSSTASITCSATKESTRSSARRMRFADRTGELANPLPSRNSRTATRRRRRPPRRPVRRRREGRGDRGCRKRWPPPRSGSTWVPAPPRVRSPPRQLASHSSSSRRATIARSARGPRRSTPTRWALSHARLRAK